MSNIGEKTKRLRVAELKIQEYLKAKKQDKREHQVGELLNTNNFEERNVSKLNKELFLAAKSIMQKDNSKVKWQWHIGWIEVGDFIDWLEKNYSLEKKLDAK